jgi:hypothetical protein
MTGNTVRPTVREPPKTCHCSCGCQRTADFDDSEVCSACWAWGHKSKLKGDANGKTRVDLPDLLGDRE